MSDTTSQEVRVVLKYHQVDEASGGGRLPVMPGEVSNLVIAIRDHPEWIGDDDGDFPENPSQLQVHLIGTASQLEALGTYLIALGRMESAEPEYYDSFDDVRYADGGTVRLIPRLVKELPSPGPRSGHYCHGFMRGEADTDQGSADSA